MLIYLAGPLFSEAERCFNAQLTGKLEVLGFRVFLSQRDGGEREKPPYEAMTPEERRRATFDLDLAKIQEADIFLFVLDGRVPDEGACVELGIAYSQEELQGKDKLLVGLQTDTRAAFLGSKLNPMVRIPLQYVAEDEEALVRAVADYRIGVERDEKGDR